MTRVAIVLCGLLLLALLATAASGFLTSFAPIYSVDEVQTGLRLAPKMWVGRTVLIRGQDVEMGLICGSSPRVCYRTPNSFDALVASPDPRTWSSGSRITPPLTLSRRNGASRPTQARPNDLAVRIAHLPILGSFVPTALIERGAVYRVRLFNAQSCTSSPCLQGEIQ